MNFVTFELLKPTKSFAAMGFNSLEFAYFDCCQSGRLKINAQDQLVVGQPGQIGVFDGPAIYSTAGLIICMIENGWTAGSTEDDTGTCRYAEKIMRSKGIKTIVLLGFGVDNQATYEWFDAAKRKYPNIRYLHINADGHWECDGAGWLGLDTTRTTVQFNDGIWPSYNSRSWIDRGLTVPAGYHYLSNSLENAHTLEQFNFANDQIRLLVIESCYGLRNVATQDGDFLINYVAGAYEWENSQNPPWNSHPDYPFSDVTICFNMFSENQAAIGGASLIIKGPYPDYRRFFNGLYTRMGDGMNFRDAYTDLRNHTASGQVSRYHRVRGLGLSALSDIYLSSNP